MMDWEKCSSTNDSISRVEARKLGNDMCKVGQHLA